VFWAERITTRRDTGHSLFWLAHGVEPLLPFNIEEATHLINPITGQLSTEDLLAVRARALKKRDKDLAVMWECKVRSEIS
jgi:hypothetical protein